MTEIETLKGAYFSGDADAVIVARLGRWLIESPDNALQFAIDSLIVRELQTRGSRKRKEEPETASPLRIAQETDAACLSSPAAHYETRSVLWAPWRLAALGAAACLLVAVAVGLLGRHHAPARLVAELDASWMGPSPSHSGLEPGRVYRLQTGLAQVETATGATLIIEGPCEVAIAGENATLLTRGKIAARCSTKQTHGFTVTTPSGRVVDLGTEFGVEHNDRGTFAYVFDGEIQAFSQCDHDDSRVIRAGEGLRLAPGGVERIGESGWSPEFVTVSDFRVALARASGSVAADWGAYYEGLRSDPDLIFWTDFDVSDEFDQPSNLCRYGDDRHKLLSTRNVAFEEGRLPSNDAVRLVGSGSLPLVRIPGVFRSLTLAAWVRLERDESTSEHRGLLLSDWSLPGSLHWQLKSGSLRLTHPSRDSQANATFSANLPPSFFDEPSWRLLVTVVETGRAGEVRHYLDGQLLAKAAIAPDSPPLRLGDCEAGGWSRAEDRRAFGGAMDDLFVWRRPLSSAEVKQLYDDGRAPMSPPQSQR